MKELFRISFLSAMETAVKLASGFIVIKFIATQVGPEGVAYFGQFQNFFVAFVIVISGGFTTGLVRYSAEEKSKQNMSYLGSALGLGLIVSCIVSLLLYLTAEQFSLWIFKSTEYTIMFKALAICGVFVMIFQVIIAALNGWGELTKFILCKIISSVLLLVVSLVLVYGYGLFGGLIGLIVMQALSGIIGIGIIAHVKNFQWKWLYPKYNMSVYKEFFPFWLMNLSTLVSTPLILMLIRSYIASKLGWEQAGIWEASWRLSELFMLVITTALLTYYVPNLSQAKTKMDELKIVKSVLFFGLITASFLALFIYIFRETIVSYLFSENFYEVTEIIGYQLTGNVIKVAVWVFSYHMMVKCRIKFFLIMELFFGMSFYVLARLFLNNYGLIGASYATGVNCLLYLIFCSIYFFRYGYGEAISVFRSGLKMS